MTEQEITDLGPAFAAYLRRFRDSFGQDRTAGHFDTYCRGLLSDLPRKTAEPIALAAGTAVRTLQEFLVTARWDHASARDTLQTYRTCPADHVIGTRRVAPHQTGAGPGQRPAPFPLAVYARTATGRTVPGAGQAVANDTFVRWGRQSGGTRI